MLVYNTLFPRILQEGNAYFLENFYCGGTRRFPALVDRGIRTAAGGFGLTGRLLFLHRLSGGRELRKRVRPDWAAPFPAPTVRGARTASAGSPFPGGEFSAEPQREIRRRCGGSVPRPAAGAKRKDNLRFSFLFELLPFPYFLIWRRFPICDRSEKEYGSRVTAACLSPPFRSSQTAYCYTCGLINAECGITVPHNSLARYIDSTCQDKLYQTLNS